MKRCSPKENRWTADKKRYEVSTLLVQTIQTLFYPSLNKIENKHSSLQVPSLQSSMLLGMFYFHCVYSGKGLGKMGKVNNIKQMTAFHCWRKQQAIWDDDLKYTAKWSRNVRKQHSGHVILSRLCNLKDKTRQMTFSHSNLPTFHLRLSHPCNQSQSQYIWIFLFISSGFLLAGSPDHSDIVVLLHYV